MLQQVQPVALGSCLGTQNVESHVSVSIAAPLDAEVCLPGYSAFCFQDDFVVVVVNIVVVVDVCF